MFLLDLRSVACVQQACLPVSRVCVVLIVSPNLEESGLPRATAAIIRASIAHRAALAY